MTAKPDDPNRPVYLGGPPGTGIAVPAVIAHQLDLNGLTLAELHELGDEAAVDDRLAALNAERERLSLAVLEHRASALQDVTRYTAAAADVAADLDAAVAEARAAGATWEQIATAAGMTRQSAWKRWS